MITVDVLAVSSVRSCESHMAVTARLTDSGSGHVAELSPGVGEGLLPSPTPPATRQQGDQGKA